MTVIQTLDSDLQRSVGNLALEIGGRGVVKRLREEGCAKLRLPARLAGQAPEAIIINTSGGLAGGDRFEFKTEATSDLCLTTQAAEKIYRSLGQETQVSTRLVGRDKARLLWLPQETILFDGARLKRSLEVELQENASLLAVESFVLGRKAMGQSLMVNARLDVMEEDTKKVRGNKPYVFADMLRRQGLARVISFIEMAGGLESVSLAR